MPLRVPFTQLVVEGLSPDDRVKVYCNDKAIIDVGACGVFPLSRPLERNEIAQAELIGVNSCVSVRLEK